MKFIHTADVHWGMEPDSDKPWSRERAQAIKDTFTQVITKARDFRGRLSLHLRRSVPSSAAAAGSERDQLLIQYHSCCPCGHDCREPRPDPQQFRCFKFFLVSERDLPHE